MSKIESAYGISQSAMMSNLDRMDKLASKVASDSISGDNDSNLVDDFVQVNISKNNFKANVETFKTADEMLSMLIGTLR